MTDNDVDSKTLCTLSAFFSAFSIAFELRYNKYVYFILYTTLPNAYKNDIHFTIYSPHSFIHSKIHQIVQDKNTFFTHFASKSR